MHEQSNQDFNRMVEKLGWSLARSANALEVRQDDIIAWRDGRRGVPDRVITILKKYVEIHEGRSPSEHYDRGSTGRTHHTNPKITDQLGLLKQAYKALAEAHYNLLKSLPAHNQTSFGPYATLGVLPGVPWEDIRSQYRTLSKNHHPDRGGDEEIMQQITQAYAELRLIYDR